MTEVAKIGESHEDLRSLLFSIAYRMLGSVSDAEDIVQESLLRLHVSLDRGVTVESPRAFLTTVATRLAIDELRSARARRETYFGPWIPEPLLVSTGPDPAEAAERDESLALSFLVLLETLSPVERAVFLLREVFAYDYDQIAMIVEKTEANCRQIFGRARQRIAARTARFQVTRQERDELAARFVDAVENGELSRLEAYLAADATFYGDGGGKARGLPVPIHGRDRIHRLLLGFLPEHRAAGGRVLRVPVNGEPGILFFDGDGHLISVFAMEIGDSGIQAIRSVINPDKLGHLGYPLSELAHASRAPARRGGRGAST
jgi:RNA polymerase sigma-70 factor (TIGR02957 family)